MTVPAADTTYRYEGNGVTTVFAYNNRLLTTADVQVQILTRATDALVETLTLTTDYTVTIVSNQLANVTITNPAKIPSITQDILLNLNIAISQTRSYPRADSLPAGEIEKGLDKLTLITQLISDRQDRTLRFPASDTTTDGELPPKAERALKYLAFDIDGAPIASEGEAGGVPAGAFGAQIVATSTQTQAVSLLGLPKSNYTAIIAPTVNDDVTFSYSVGSIWADTVTGKFYECASPADGAAVWLEVVFATSTQTLTNKTLTSPTINSTIRGTAIAQIAQGTLTLTSGSPYQSVDVASATTVYYTPCVGNKTAVYNGSSWELYSLAELSLPLGTLTSGQGYDVFLNYNAGAPTLVMTAWTDSVTRATALVRQDGVLCKSGTLTHRYLGSFLTTSTTTTADAIGSRYLYNEYNAVDKGLAAGISTGNYGYTTNTWRSANGNTTNGDGRFSFFVGNIKNRIQITGSRAAFNSTNQIHTHGIAFNGTTSAELVGTQAASALGAIATTTCHASAMPRLGLNFVQAMETSVASGTTTWYGAATGGGLTATYPM